MANRFSQTPVEVVLSPDSSARFSQTPVEVVLGDASKLRVSQTVVEVVREARSPINVSQAPLEVIAHGLGTPDVTISQAVAEAIFATTIQRVRISQLVAEIIVDPYSKEGKVEVIAAVPEAEVSSGSAPQAILGQVEVIADPSAVVTSFTAETAFVQVTVAVPEAAVDAENYGIISQAAREALTQATDADAEISQVSREAFVRADEELEISQVTKSPVVRADEELEISQVTRAGVSRAEEELEISQVTRSTIIRRKRPDWWPMHNRLIQQQAMHGAKH